MQTVTESKLLKLCSVILFHTTRVPFSPLLIWNFDLFCITIRATFSSDFFNFSKSRIREFLLLGSGKLIEIMNAINSSIWSSGWILNKILYDILITGGNRLKAESRAGRPAIEKLANPAEKTQKKLTHLIDFGFTGCSRPVSTSNLRAKALWIFCV